MFQPLRDHILVKHSGLMASRSLQVIWNRDNDQQIWFHGTVKAVGPGKRDKKGNVRPLTVQPGDVVAYGKFQFPKYHEGGEEYLILQEADVVGVVEQSTT